jgi:hypothetical protein
MLPSATISEKNEASIAPPPPAAVSVLVGQNAANVASRLLLEM